LQALAISLSVFLFDPSITQFSSASEATNASKACSFGFSMSLEGHGMN